MGWHLPFGEWIEKCQVQLKDNTHGALKSNIMFILIYYNYVNRFDPDDSAPSHSCISPIDPVPNLKQYPSQATVDKPHVEVKTVYFLTWALKNISLLII